MTHVRTRAEERDATKEQCAIDIKAVREQDGQV
jgi:hypothetical protein